MSWLNLRKKKEEPKGAAAPSAKKIAVHEARAVVTPTKAAVGTDVLLRPRVTEKATALSERGVYAFEVTNRATAGAVKAAVRALYSVSPVKVAFVPMRRKTIVVKGKPGRTKGGRKAYVYLKEGNKIEIV